MPCTATFPFATNKRKTELKWHDKTFRTKEGKRKKGRKMKYSRRMNSKTIPILLVTIHIHFNDEGVRTILLFRFYIYSIYYSLSYRTLSPYSFTEFSFAFIHGVVGIPSSRMNCMVLSLTIDSPSV